MHQSVIKIINCSQAKFVALILVLWSRSVGIKWPSNSLGALRFASLKVCDLPKLCWGDVFMMWGGRFLVLSLTLPLSHPLDTPSTQFQPGDLNSLSSSSHNPAPYRLTPPLLLIPPLLTPPNAGISEPQLTTSEANRSPVVWDEIARR